MPRAPSPCGGPCAQSLLTSPQVEAAGREATLREISPIVTKQLREETLHCAPPPPRDAGA